MSESSEPFYVRSKEGWVQYSILVLQPSSVYYATAWLAHLSARAEIMFNVQTLNKGISIFFNHFRLWTWLSLSELQTYNHQQAEHK